MAREPAGRVVMGQTSRFLRVRAPQKNQLPRHPTRILTTGSLFRKNQCPSHQKKPAGVTQQTATSAGSRHWVSFGSLGKQFSDRKQTFYVQVTESTNGSLIATTTAPGINPSASSTKLSMSTNARSSARLG